MASEPTAKLAVEMTDGRTVEFTTKQKLNKETTIADGVVTVRLDFRNGETRSFVIPDSLMLQFAGHGAEQKLGDAIAGESDVDDAVLAVDALIERLNGGEWSKAREGGSFAGSSVLLRALVEASGKPVESLKAYLSSKTQAEKLALRRSDRLRPIIERIESEKASKSKTTVDTDSLLGELDELEAA